MAIVYGMSQAERKVIDQTPDSVTGIEDVETVHKSLIDDLESKKKIILKNSLQKSKKKKKR